MSKEKTQKTSVELIEVLKRFLVDAGKQGWNGVHSVYSKILNEKGEPLNGFSFNDALRAHAKALGMTKEKIEAYPGSLTTPAERRKKQADGSYKVFPCEAGLWVKEGFITSRFTKGGVYIKATEKLGLTPIVAVSGKSEPEKKEEKSDKKDKLFSKVFSK